MGQRAGCPRGARAVAVSGSRALERGAGNPSFPARRAEAASLASLTINPLNGSSPLSCRRGGRSFG
jgi:hypothetical protein